MFQITVPDKHASFEFNGQSQVSITHNLNKVPAVQIFDDNNEKVDAHINPTSTSNILIEFYANGVLSPQSGTVVLN